MLTLIPSSRCSILDRVTDALWARHFAHDLLKSDERRWTHVTAVAARAEGLASALISDTDDADVLVAAAWLHDIGYAPALVETGCHHLDGARRLRSLGYERLASLVAHHGSGAKEAGLRGLADEMAEFPVEVSLVADSLTFCDLTCGPGGGHVELNERIAEVSTRYGPDDVVVRGLTASLPELEACFARVGHLLAHPI